MEFIGRTAFLPKVLYGALFVCALPLALIAWAHGTRNAVHLGALQSQPVGIALAILGTLVIATGMLALFIRGGGLPMNAFPPPRFVLTGIYGLVADPIYGGFVILSAGVAIMAGSASGLWLVTPLVALASSALVLGHELPDLRRRFGSQMFSVWLPPDSDAAPRMIERIRAYFTVLLPWLVAYELVLGIGAPRDAIQTWLPFESRMPVLEWTEAIYASTYVVVVLTPLLLSSRKTLRSFSLRALSAMALIFPLFLLLPFIAPPRPFVAMSPLGAMLNWERTIDSSVAAFPSFHVVWALIAASALGHGSRVRKALWLTWAVLVAASCVTTGMHSCIDVLGGLAAFALVVKLPAIWKRSLKAAELIANSWKEWRFGPVRVINHGAYAGAATFVGMCIISAIVGRNSHWLILSIYLCATIGAALWAQWVEGSPSLLRPLGFYGGMLGAIAGALVALPLRLDLWTTLCAICIAAPFIQALGRLRCLVQGCCHGRATNSVPGISYTHPRSRVCRLAGLSAIPVHATQVYSIAWNGVVAAVLLRLLLVQSSTALICGVYLLLSGVGRFVEEAYRGEPQTLVLFGLRFYQWLAIATMLAGAIITTVSRSPVAPHPSIGSIHWVLAIVCGFAAWFVTGIDFPESSRRFARLT